MKTLCILIFLFVSQFANAKCKAILINGGADPANNYSVHIAELREMYNTLTAKGCAPADIHVFSASGSTESPDFRLDPTAADSRYVANPYKFDGVARVPNLYAADKATLQTRIAKLSSEFSAADKVFIYVADHGTNINGKKGLVPWYGNGNSSQIFTPEDMEKALAGAPTETRIKIWTECCYCGAFNRIKRSNTCIATSTDEFHVGNYNWNNWHDYAKKNMQASGLTSNMYFAGQIKNGAASQSSLLVASRVAWARTVDDKQTMAETLAKGCFVGPRDSLEQFVYATLGFAAKQVCLKDISKIMGVSTEDKPGCIAATPTDDITKLKIFLEQMKDENAKLNYSERGRLDKLIADIGILNQRLENSDENRQIKKINADFNKMTESQKIATASFFQDTVLDLKATLAKKYNGNQLLQENQRLIMESLFFAKATAKQKDEYSRRKQCLEEPLL